MNNFTPTVWEHFTLLGRSPDINKIDVKLLKGKAMDLYYSPVKYFDFLIEDDSQIYDSKRTVNDIVVPPKIFYGGMPSEPQFLEFNIDVHNMETWASLEEILNQTQVNSENTKKFIQNTVSKNLNRNYIAETFEFLEYHLNRYFEKQGDTRPFLFYLLEILPDFPEIRDERKKTIIAWVEEKKNEVKNNVQTVKSEKKIKWLGSPAILAFLMQEFVEREYIEPPKYGGEPSMSGLAKLCYKYFEIDVTPEYFERAMRNPEALAYAKKQKFTIPNLSDLA